MKKVWVVAGIVIVIALVFFVFKKTQENLDVGEKLGIHGDVIGYGTYIDKEKIEEEFTKVYNENAKEGKKIYLVTGENGEFVISSYEKFLIGKINLDFSGKKQEEIKEEIYTEQKFEAGGKATNVIINGKSYEFKLKPGENVYFIIQG